MATKSIPSNIGRTAIERRAKKGGFFSGMLSSLLGVSWLAALSKISTALTEFFKQHQAYFVAGGIVLSAINWIIYFVQYLNSGNKNPSKTANVIYKSAMLLFSIATTVAMFCISIAVGGMMLGVSLFIDPIINLIKAGFFAIQWIRAAVKKDEAYSAFFRKKTAMALAFSVVGGLVSLGFVALFLMPGLPLLATAGIAVVGSVIMMAPYIVAGIQKLVRWIRNKKATHDVTSSDEDEDEEVAVVQIIPNPNTDVTSHQSKKHVCSFYRYSVTHECADLDELRDHIDTVKIKIASQIKISTGLFKEKYLWSQNPKRQAQMNALNFLLDFIDHIEDGSIPVRASKQHPLVINHHAFDYKNIKHLIKQIDLYVLKSFPSVYQSSKEIGKVQDCFNQAYLLLLNSDQPAQRLAI